MAQAKAVQLFQAGRIEESLREIDRAAKLHPKNTQIALVQCTLQRRTGHLEEALVGLSRVIDREPDHADALCQRAFVHQQIGAAGWAEHAFQDSGRSIKSGYESSLAFIIHGNALFAMERFDESIQSYHDAISVSPHSAGAHAGRARAWMALGDFEQASDDLARAYELDPAPEDRAAMDELAVQLQNLRQL